jgi:MFS family permease
MGASVSAIISAVFFGYLSDVIGRKKSFLLIGVLDLVFLPLLFQQLADAASVPMIAFYALALAFLGNAAYAPILVFLNERFPTSIRSSGTGLSWNIGFAVGGMMPTFVTLASATTEQIPQSLMYFSIGIFVLYIIGGIVVPETKGKFE